MRRSLNAKASFCSLVVGLIRSLFNLSLNYLCDKFIFDLVFCVKIINFKSGLTDSRKSWQLHVWFRYIYLWNFYLLLDSGMKIYKSKDLKLLRAEQIQ